MIQGPVNLVRIESMPPDEMRYSTEGDWMYTRDGVLVIQVSANAPLREQILIALHELIEAFLCENQNVSQVAVDAFDMSFTGDGEPGDAPDAPYRKQHRFAALIDHLIAHELGMQDYGRVDWEPRE